MDSTAGQLQFRTCTVVGGVVTTSGGTAAIVGTSTFDAVTFDADLGVTGGLALRVRGGLANDGVITVNPTNAGIATDLFFEESGTIGGTGTVVLGGSSTRAGLSGEAGVVITNSGPAGCG